MSEAPEELAIDEVVARMKARVKAETRSWAHLDVAALRKDPSIQELKRQNGDCCEICSQPCVIQLDHNHATGSLRGFLCRTCNVGLGMFRDDPALLQRAAEYLLERTEA